MGRPVDSAALAGQSVVVWGCGGHAAVLLDVLNHYGVHVRAFVDQHITETLIQGVPVLSGEEAWLTWRSSQAQEFTLYGVAAIGRPGGHRQRVQAFFESHGVAMPQLIHPHASISSQARLGGGVQILAGAVVAARAQLGDMCIINHRASVDHECVLDSGVTIAPGATLCGCVRVGEDAFIGAGATVLPRLSIGAGAMVGAGAVVTRDVAPGAVVCGNPARCTSEARH